MNRLPQELLDIVLSGLTGFELFQVSHVNAALFRLLSDEQLWERFFSYSTTKRSDGNKRNGGSTGCRKRQYMRSNLLRFDGLPKQTEGLKYRGQCVPVRQDALHFQVMWRGAIDFIDDFGPGRIRQTLAIDTWFCLLEDDPRIHSGGVIFGAQSFEAESLGSSNYHQGFIMVDSTRNLFCSLLDQDKGHSKPVAPDLAPCRWYHLALTYDGISRVENVYLNGKLATSRVGRWHREWSYLNNAQIGTGCVAADTTAVPVAGHAGWYGFHGVVAEFRVWQRELTEQEVQLIAKSAPLPDDSSVWFALSTMQGTALSVKRLRCTQPSERWLQRQPQSSEMKQ